MNGKRSFIFLFIILTTQYSFGGHLVGGELYATTIDSNWFSVDLVLFFDDENGNQSAIDLDVKIGVYDVVDSSFIDQFDLKMVSDKSIEPLDSNCTNNHAIRRLFYSDTVYIDTNIYKSGSGYILVYDRCCRNESYRNIESNGTTGMAITTKIPELKLIENSSPQFILPYIEYACTNHEFRFNMKATDDDGDSLVYSLTFPRKGNTIFGDPIIFDYSTYQLSLDSETYKMPYSYLDPMASNTPFKIDSMGLISVIPTDTGNYIYSIKCEEYRGGIKIGEVIRDFRLIVEECFSEDTSCIPDGTNGLINPDSTIDSLNIVKDNFNDKNVKIFPMPFSSYLDINFEQISDNMTIEIKDMKGKVVFSKKLLKASDRINVNELSKGIYLARITAGKHVYIRKLIKN